MNIKLVNQDGQIALPFILLVGGIIIEIVLATSFVSFFVSASALGEKLSVRALSAANTGIYDAIMKISRNKEFGLGEIDYEIVMNDDDTIAVSVSREVDDLRDIYIYTIESVASAQNRQKKIIAIIVVNQTTGKIDVQSIGEEAT